MRARIWNAYASNNSGSYTIIGKLPSVEVAERTATELREMIDAHTAWRDVWDGKTSLDESPLAQFCLEHGLTWSAEQGGWDEWPEHSNDNRPRVVVSGTQVVVHHEYTVSLPPTFGELFYKRGGRVEHEEVHAHEPLVVTARFCWGWTKEDRAVQEAELPRLVAALTAPDGVLAGHSRVDSPPPAWRAEGQAFGEAPLTVGVVFDDLVEGVAALRAQAEAHGAHLELRLAEATAATDPLAHLRPCIPAAPRFDVVITDVGDHRPRLVEALMQVTGLSEVDARAQLQQQPPITVASGLMEVRARDMVSMLEGARARVEMRRNDA